MGIDNAKSKIVKVISDTRDSVTYAPMLCILFLGTRMRALQLTQGKGAPQQWVQTSMLGCAYCVLAQLIFVLIASVMMPEEAEKVPDPQTDPEQGEDPKPKKDPPADEGLTAGEKFIMKAISGVMQAGRFSAMIGLYGAAIAVCAGVMVMTPEDCMPKKEASKLWAKGPPPVSPALSCTMNLTIQFFAVFLGYEIFKVAYGFLKSTAFGISHRDMLEVVLT